MSLLWNYEEHLAKAAGLNATTDEHERSAIWRLRASDSIEHILPQNPGPEWNDKLRRGTGEVVPLADTVGRIGNLLLLPTALNAEARAAGFAAKKVAYGKHQLRMIREVDQLPDWTIEEIDAREIRIVEWARTRWADL